MGCGGFPLIIDSSFLAEEVGSREGRVCSVLAVVYELDDGAVSIDRFKCRKEIISTCRALSMTEF